jgi:predicted RNA-binding Zn ribbon-like protein
MSGDESPTSMIVVSRPFSPGDLVAGHPALDLVNTVTARNTPVPRDWLDGYERVLEWARLANITDEKVLTLLGKQAAASLESAACALARLKQFREALHTAYAALLSGKRVPQPILDELEVIWLEAQSRLRLEYSENRLAARVSVERSGFDLIRDCLAGSAIELLHRLPTDRARICRGHSCGWLFIDSSKGGQRVWCDMATCGNASKTRRHQKNAERRRRTGRRPARGGPE